MIRNMVKLTKELQSSDVQLQKVYPCGVRVWTACSESQWFFLY